MLRLLLAGLARQAGSTQAVVQTAIETMPCVRALSSSQSLGTLHLCRRTFSASPEPDTELNPEASQRVVDIVDAIENLSVKDLVWLNKLLKERLGVSDAELGIGMPMAMPMAAAGAPAAAEAAEEAAPEKTEFKVIIEGYEASAKIKIIKELRSVVSGLGLKEAKELVEKLPATVKGGITKEEAEELQKKFEAVGAKIKLD